MVIAVFGQVGAGKSTVLNYLADTYGAVVLKTDEIAHMLYEPGQAGHEALEKLFGTGIFCADGTVDRKHLGNLIYTDIKKRMAVNEAIHPLVWAKVKERIKQESDSFIVVESALPPRNGSDMFDEIWYLYTSVSLRKKRLKENRNISDERFAQIDDSQPSEEVYRHLAGYVLNNDKTPEELKATIDEYLAGKVVKIR